MGVKYLSHENNSSTNSQVKVNAQSSTSSVTNQENIIQNSTIAVEKNDKTDNIQEILVNTDSDSSDNSSNKDTDIVVDVPLENLP